MIVLIRRPSPCSSASRYASITNSRQPRSTNVCCASRGRLAHTSSGGTGELSNTVAPGVGTFENVETVEEAGIVHATNSARRIWYVERIGAGPNRRCDTVVAPAFFES